MTLTMETTIRQGLHAPPTELALQDASSFLGLVAGDPAFLAARVHPLLEEAQSAEGWYVAHRHDAPDGASLQIFVWPPGSGTEIHDHSSWGAFRCVVGSVLEERYVRLDDGSAKDYARLRKLWWRTWTPQSGVSSVPPYDGGIHRIGNPDDSAAISIHVYGPRTGQIEGRDYDPSPAYVCDRQAA